MTDHKVLAKIRNKPYFNNSRINRWTEEIQEFDFTIKYVKEEMMTDADDSSRQYESVEMAEEEKIKEQKKKIISRKTITGQRKKHTVENDEENIVNFQQVKSRRF
ncbi:hypothetical protein NGRA_2767 [Nosema granulosis]|uniref:Uncharacterized protein n=1 Tax=Nosema granulosis TaxID=83296 RepID=A0A9P6GX38_9MICR|nr:hypothetical protein NGRA_2767 [Nosema granulosis]